MEILIAIIGLIIAILTFYYQYNKEPKEHRAHLETQFRVNQNMSRNLVDILYKYCEKYNAWEDPAFPGVTYRFYIQSLEHSLSTNLSDKLLEDSKGLPLSKHNIDSMVKSLEEQYKALRELYNTTCIMIGELPKV